ncbi:MAG: hypothetical protein ACXVPQ_10500 [Bacteroidia bacterium]
MKTNILFALLLSSLLGFAGGPTRLLKHQVNSSLTYVAYTETGRQALLGVRYLSATGLPSANSEIRNNAAKSLRAGSFNMIFCYVPMTEFTFCIFLFIHF